MKLRELGEERLLQRILPLLPRSGRSVISGAGDDCAVVEFGETNDLLLKTDCVVEGVHFTSEAKPRAVGWKAIARPLSDLAAMAGLPQFALVTLIAPAETRVRWVEEFYRGAASIARRFDLSIVGGETSRVDGPISISVSVAGAVEKGRAILRSGGKAGDELFVTGRLGGSIRGKHLRFNPRIVEARWLAQHFEMHAMMDLSDGLGADLPRLAEAGGLAFEVSESEIPRTRGCSTEQALSDGEDYELLFAVAPDESLSLQRKWRRKFPELPLTRIGSLQTRSSKSPQPQLNGYVHFQ